MVARLKRRARRMPRRSPFRSVMPAFSMATSVPVPMAIPTSAAASAGASLMPSPAIATIWPCWRRRADKVRFLLRVSLRLQLHRYPGTAPLVQQRRDGRLWRSPRSRQSRGAQLSREEAEDLMRSAKARTPTVFCSLPTNTCRGGFTLFGGRIVRLPWRRLPRGLRRNYQRADPNCVLLEHGLLRRLPGVARNRRPVINRYAALRRLAR